MKAFVADRFDSKCSSKSRRVGLEGALGKCMSDFEESTKMSRESE